MILKPQWCIESIPLPLLEMLRNLPKTYDSETGRMEAPSRISSQAEAPLSQHMENIKGNTMILISPHTHHRWGRGGVLTLLGGARASDHIYIYMYICIFIYVLYIIDVYIHVKMYM